MTNDSTGTGWLAKGCGISCLGCGFLILVGVFVTFTFAPNVVERTRGLFDRESLVAQWQGPERDQVNDATSAAMLLPAEVDGLERGAIELGPGPDSLGLDEDDFWQATYGGSSRSVQLWVMATDERDAEWAFGRARAARNRSGGATSTLETGNVLSFTWGSPRQAAALWAPDDWLFVIYSETSKDATGFGEALLQATDFSPDLDDQETAATD